MSDEKPEDADQPLSDVPADSLCKRCNEQMNRHIQAVCHCEDCNAFMCQSCLEVHQSLPSVRNHKILEGDDMPKSQADKPVSASFSTDTEVRMDQRDILEITANKVGALNINHGEDSNACEILDMVISNDGNLFMTDYENEKLKVFSRDNRFLSSLKFSTYPYCISVINSTTAVVSSSGNHLNFLDVYNPKSLSVKRSVLLQYTFIGLTAYNGRLIVTTRTVPESVKMIELDGHVLWSTSSDPNGKQLFQYPAYLITRAMNDKTAVIVTDYGKDTITLLDADTGNVFKIINVKGKGPRGVTTDTDGNVYICYWNTREIGLWSADFSHSRILLSGSSLQDYPRGIVIHAAKDEIFICYGLSNYNIDRFQLKHTKQQQLK